MKALSEKAPPGDCPIDYSASMRCMKTIGSALIQAILCALQ
jgi:hypothetical protein